MPAIVLSEQQFLLLQLIVNNAMRIAMNKIAAMSDDDVKEAIIKEESRSQTLIQEIDEH